MPVSSEYECGECRHRFRTPEGAPRDVRMLMCPACGSIDLTLMTVERPAPPVMRAREGAPVEQRRASQPSARS
jgi:DNA-directed RNA polymerase subunit RPC12/RpoP